MPHGSQLLHYRRVARDSFHLCQRGIPVARRPIPTSASFWRGKDMLYFWQKYALNHSIVNAGGLMPCLGSRHRFHVIDEAICLFGELNETSDHRALLITVSYSALSR
jgi:hypothetical protein